VIHPGAAVAAIVIVSAIQMAVVVRPTAELQLIMIRASNAAFAPMNVAEPLLI